MPIYEQIRHQIRLAIIRDEIAAGDALPSIRSLAAELKISVITTKRAYDDLEEEGFITTVQGKGCFVLEKNTERIREHNLKEIEQHLIEAIKAAKLMRLKSNELVEMVKYLYKEEY